MGIDTKSFIFMSYNPSGSDGNAEIEPNSSSVATKTKKGIRCPLQQKSMMYIGE